VVAILEPIGLPFPVEEPWIPNRGDNKVITNITYDSLITSVKNWLFTEGCHKIKTLPATSPTGSYALLRIY
jgi:hypothetical protein